MATLIDTHIHLDFLGDLQSQVAEARAAGVTQFVVPGAAPHDWSRMMATVHAVDGAVAAPGVHPQAADQWNRRYHRSLLEHLEDPRCVAIGEVGLDRAAGVEKHLQEEVFRQMIRLACEVNKPLLIHQRKAVGRLLELLREEGADRVGGILHAFSGSLEVAEQAIDLGFALGVGGILTYPEARRLPEVARQVPSEWLVLETDAPDISPHPVRDQPNRAANLLLVARRLAEIRSWTFAEMAAATTANARRILRWPDNL